MHKLELTLDNIHWLANDLTLFKVSLFTFPSSSIPICSRVKGGSIFKCSGKIVDGTESEVFSDFRNIHVCINQELASFMNAFLAVHSPW